MRSRTGEGATPETAQETPPEIVTKEVAAAGLRFWTDARPGYTRRRAGRGFSYRDAKGRRITSAATIDRIRRLAIPPAWADVWICPDPVGHLQATGRDARGRKQYRYHPRYRREQERTKFERLVEFGRALPRIRRRVNEDLALPGLPDRKVLAAVTKLLELTGIRVGNEEYARLNRSFGLTTLRDRHATVEGETVRFRFRAKSGKVVEAGLRDRRIARIVARCQDLPGQELFQYTAEDGSVHGISSEDVNAYLREAAGADVTAKSFRTWTATVLACRALRGGLGDLEATSPSRPRAASRRGVLTAMRHVAERLGNTATVVRQSYVHPAVVDAYLDGALGTGDGVASSPAQVGDGRVPSRAEELAVLRILAGEAPGARR